MGNAQQKQFDYTFVGTYTGPFSNKYRILRELGSGAEGITYLVERKKRRRKKSGSVLGFSLGGFSFGGEGYFVPELFVAKQSKDLSQAGKQDFLAEFERMRQLQHPNCVKVLELVEGRQRLSKGLCEQVYVISELAKGSDLFQYMQRMLDHVEFVDERWVAQVFRQAMQGVAFMHGKGVVHNDLKPDNFLVMDEFDPFDPDHVPTVKVSDFGCATAARDTNLQFGDPRYQSPETWQRIVQVVEKHRSSMDFYKMPAAADVWSLGATLFELLSGGKIPFLYRHASLSDVLGHKELWRELKEGVLSQEEVQVRAHCPDVSLEVVELLGQMFQRDPASRPPVSALLDHSWFGMTEQRILNWEVLSTLELNHRKGLAHCILLNALVSKMKTDHLRVCWAAFQAVDTDHSGSINLQEFTEAMTRLGRETTESEKLFREADLDRDEKLSFTEFAAATFDPKATEPEALDAAVKNLFATVDTNSSGKLNVRELARLFRGVLDTASVKRLFASMDLDGDGKVSLEEFRDFLQPCSERFVSSFRMAQKRRRRRSGAALACSAACRAWLGPLREGCLR